MILLSVITGFVSFSDFASFVGIIIGTASSAVELKYFPIVAGIGKYKSTIKEKRKTHDKILFLAKAKWNIWKSYFLRLWSTQILVIMNLFPWIC